TPREASNTFRRYCRWGLASLSSYIWACTAQAKPPRRVLSSHRQCKVLGASSWSILICFIERKHPDIGALFLLGFLGPQCEARDVVSRQALSGPQEIGHFPRAAADDLGQVGRYTPRQGKQLIGILPNDLGNLSDLVLGRRFELAPLDLGEIGWTHPNLLRHLAQPDSTCHGFLSA